VEMQDRILKFSEAQHPIVLQLGGSSPEKLLKAAKLASVYGYDEINLKYATLSIYLPCFQDNYIFKTCFRIYLKNIQSRTYVAL
jgi:hypothetical protein